MSGEIKYPDEFLRGMKALLQGEYDAFVASLGTPSPTSVRLNPHKPLTKFDSEEPIPWCANGRYLSERPSFTFDPLFHAGTYYVQEASSMFLEQVWKQINPANNTVRVLDMCAAPGGKSTHLLSLMNADSLLVTNELVPNRNRILQQNIIKWGHANCIITQNKSEDFAALNEYFDIILVDAPCSGEGLFRKDKEAIDEWSSKNVAACSVRQSEILKQATACLKPGGYLIYSTCTFEPAENDKQIELLVGVQNFEPLHTSRQMETQDFASLQITRTQYGYQFYPHKVKGEGFYIAVVKKKGEAEPAVAKPHLNFPAPSFANYLQHNENFAEEKKNELLFAIPRGLQRDFNFLQRHLYIRNAGILMGSIKGKDFLPSHDLALSTHLQKDLPKVELDYDTAIAYLRCETPRVHTGLRGWALASYLGMNLGWMKLLDNRWNNYFPKDWRILKR